MSMISGFLIRTQGYDLNTLRSSPQNEYNLASSTGWILVFYFFIQTVIMYHFLQYLNSGDSGSDTSFFFIFAALLISCMLTVFDIVLGSGYVTPSRLLIRLPVALLIATFGALVLMSQLFKDDIARYNAVDRFNIESAKRTEINNKIKDVQDFYIKLSADEVDKIPQPNQYSQDLDRLTSEISEQQRRVENIENAIKKSEETMATEARTGRGVLYDEARRQRNSARENLPREQQLLKNIREKHQIDIANLEKKKNEEKLAYDKKVEAVYKTNNEKRDAETKKLRQDLDKIKNEQIVFTGVASRIKALWEIVFSPGGSAKKEPGKDAKEGGKDSPEGSSNPKEGSWGASIAIIVVYMMLVFMELGYVIAKFITSRQMPAYWSAKTFEKNAIISSHRLTKR